MQNAALCGEHRREARERWVYIGLHPYTEACAASGGAAVWLPDEDRCVIPGPVGCAAQCHEAYPPAAGLTGSTSTDPTWKYGSPVFQPGRRPFGAG